MKDYKEAKETSKKNLLVKKSKFAEMCGVHPATVSNAIKRGILLDVEKKIDLSDPLSVKFMQRNTDRVERESIIEDAKNDPDHLKKIQELEYRQAVAKTNRMEIDVRKDMNKLIDKEIVKILMMSIAKNIRELLLPLGSRIVNELAGIFECTDPQKISDAIVLINKEHSVVIKAIKEIAKQDIRNDMTQEEEEEE